MASSCIVLHVCVLSALRHSYRGLSCFLMIRSRTFFDGRKGFVLFSKEYKKSEPFSYRKKVRILLLWCTSRDSNPGPLIKRNQRATIVNFQNCVNLCFVSAAFFAPIIPSCIRHPAVPVCKKCAKMCRAKISPLKQALSFYAKPEKWPGSSPIRQLRSCLFRSSIKCTSTTTIHGRDLDNRTSTTLPALT